MVELEIYRAVRRSLVIQSKRYRAMLRITPFVRSDHTRAERDACQYAMMELRKLLYGG